MAFFDFNLINDPPNDQLVDEQVYLNQNFDKLDTRLTQFENYQNAIPNPPIGTESIRDANGNVFVWTGTQWKAPQFIGSDFGQWTNIRLLSPIVERPGFTPRFRVNTVNRLVELTGDLRATSASGPWPRSKVQVTPSGANLAGSGIANVFRPVGNVSIQQVACGIGTTSGQFASARLHIEGDATTQDVKLYVSYQGDDVGGNFVVLDGVRWFY